MSMCGTSPTCAVKESGRGNRKTWPNDHSPHPPPPPHLPLVRRTGRLPPNTASFSQVRIWCSLVMNPILFSSVRPIERHPPLDHGGHLARRVFLSLFWSPGLESGPTVPKLVPSGVLKPYRADGNQSPSLIPLLCPRRLLPSHHTSKMATSIVRTTRLFWETGGRGEP